MTTTGADACIGAVWIALWELGPGAGTSGGVEAATVPTVGRYRTKKQINDKLADQYIIGFQLLQYYTHINAYIDICMYACASSYIIVFCMDLI